MKPRAWGGLCGGVLTLWLLIGGLAPWLPLAPESIDLARTFAPPDAAHWLGYDDLGRSIADRVLAGARVSCVTALAVLGLASTVGLVLGAGCALAGGWVDRVGSRLTDLFLAFPGLLLAIALAGLLGPGPGNVVLALGAVSWVGVARLARGQTLAVLAREHVLAAQALGSSRAYVLRRHVLPLIAAPLVAEASFVLAGAVLAEAGLSYLGLGAQPPQPSWGSMIRDATHFLLVAPHMVLGPVLALLSLTLAANGLGEWWRARLPGER